MSMAIFYSPWLLQALPNLDLLVVSGIAEMRSEMKSFPQHEHEARCSPLAPKGSSVPQPGPSQDIEANPGELWCCGAEPMVPFWAQATSALC